VRRSEGRPFATYRSTHLGARRTASPLRRRRVRPRHELQRGSLLHRLFLGALDGPQTMWRYKDRHLCFRR
jgi:hypothetical protein